MIPISRNGENTLDTRIVPVIFVPGVMGSRLEFLDTEGWFTKVNYFWDPDDAFRMLRWVRTFPDSQRSIMHRWKNVKIMTKPPEWVKDSEYSDLKLSEDEIAQGWGTAAIGIYSPFLRQLAKQSFGTAQVPVYAVGYDWRQGNKESGEFLAGKIVEIITAINEKLGTEAVTKVIIVTHSMGGLVARAALKGSPDLADKVLGVLHVVQPVEGAPVAYRRFFTGMVDKLDGGMAFSKILGNTGAKFSTIVSGLPGPIELLPTNKYLDTRGKNWLGYLEKGILKHWVINENESIYDIYNSKESPPGLIFSDQLEGTDASDSIGVSSDSGAAQDIRSNVENAKNFHDWLGDYKHEQTWAIHGSGLETDIATYFNPSKPPPVRIKEYKQPDGIIDAEKVIDWVHRGAKEKRFAEGDGTVPSMSGKGLFPKDPAVILPPKPRINAKTRQFTVKYLEHGAAFANSEVQEAASAVVRYLLSLQS